VFILPFEEQIHRRECRGLKANASYFNLIFAFRESATTSGVKGSNHGLSWFFRFMNWTLDESHQHFHIRSPVLDDYTICKTLARMFHEWLTPTMDMAVLPVFQFSTIPMPSPDSWILTPDSFSIKAGSSGL